MTFGLAQEPNADKLHGECFIEYSGCPVFSGEGGGHCRALPRLPACHQSLNQPLDQVGRTQASQWPRRARKSSRDSAWHPGYSNFAFKDHWISSVFRASRRSHHISKLGMHLPGLVLMIGVSRVFVSSEPLLRLPNGMPSGDMQHLQPPQEEGPRPKARCSEASWSVDP